MFDSKMLTFCSIIIFPKLIEGHVTFLITILCTVPSLPHNNSEKSISNSTSRFSSTIESSHVKISSTNCSFDETLFQHILMLIKLSNYILSIANCATFNTKNLNSDIAISALKEGVCCPFPLSSIFIWVISEPPSLPNRIPLCAIAFRTCLTVAFTDLSPSITNEILDGFNPHWTSDTSSVGKDEYKLSFGTTSSPTHKLRKRVSS